MNILLFGLSGAAVAAGIALIRRSDDARRRLHRVEGTNADALARIRRGRIAGWVCFLCGVALLLLRLATIVL